MKSIIIVGGGISGLSCLHYLNKNLKSGTTVTLLEKSPISGGTTQSQREDGVIFEYGPNGFLNLNPSTLQLASELGLKHELIEANSRAKKRFIILNNRLIEIPVGPQAFLKSSLFNPFEKLSLLQEIFKTPSKDPSESVYAFTKRRFGKKFADYFAVPMIKGIYAGNANEISLAAAFPQLKKIEQEHGSLIRYAIKQKSNKTTSLYAFRLGMSQIIETLSVRYKDQIKLSCEVREIKKNDDIFRLKTSHGEIEADQVILSTTAYAASSMVEALSPVLSKLLSEFIYRPVCVIGLLIKSTDLPQKPKGFGFLYPGKIEDSPVLGVLFESDIFESRAPEGYILLRVMMPAKEVRSKEFCITTALQELEKIFGVNINAKKTFFHHWPKAIPQYDLKYVERKNKIQEVLKTIDGLKLCANYYVGISFNDCIEHAQLTAKEISQSPDYDYSSRS